METAVHINIEIDKKHYQVHVAQMTGAQLKQLAGIPASNLLLREGHGQTGDEQIADNAPVALHDGDHFYDMPPGTFGSGRCSR